MRIIRLASSLLVAVVALSFMVVSSASAAESPNPLFTPASGQTVTGSGETSSLLAGANLITCEKNTVVSGKVANSLLIGNIVIHYLNCTATAGEGGSGCPVRSTNTTNEGLILTNTLHAILGIELPANRTVVVFLPQAGKEFVTFAPSISGTKECTPETSVSGTVAGLVTPAGTGAQTTGKVTVGGPGVLVHLTHNLGLITTKLVVFGITGTLTQSDAVTFGVATEVT
jgi:hypothetical protein